VHVEAKIWNCQKYQVVRSAKKRPSANLSGRARLSAMPAMLRSIRSLALPNQITAYEVLLYKAEPTAQVAIQKSAGYAVFSRHRGTLKVDWIFTFACAAYNLVRMRNLMRSVVPT